MKSSLFSIWISGAVIASIGVFCIAFNFQNIPFRMALDQNFRDHFLRLSTSDEPDTRIAIIDLDEASLQRIGPWPWSRSQIADLAEKTLLDQGAASLGLDIILSHSKDQQGDARLAALGQVTPLTFAFALDYAIRDEEIHVGHLPVSAGEKINHSLLKVPHATGYISNHLGLENVRCAGNIGYIPDKDGIVRTIPLISIYQDKQYWSLAQALLICAGFESTPSVSASKLWKLPFKYSTASLLVVPAADVLSGDLPTDVLKGRHVLVGSSSLSLGDHVSTPLNPLAAGVFVHAAALSALLDYQEKKIHPSRDLNWIPIAWICASFFLIWLFLQNLSPLINIAVIGFSVSFWLLLAYINITIFHIEHSIIVPLSGYALISIFVFPLEWWLTRRKEHALLKVFANYVGKPVLTELIRLDLKHSLNPDLREVTVLVVDMQGYTQRIMDLPLEDAAKFTRQYLELLTKPVLESQGTLDKYTGDGLVAFWGAPLKHKNHADLAVSCALSMQESIQKFSTYSKNSVSPIQIRIGIESGTVLVGDMGTSFRSSYTAVGDCINLASRLETLSKVLGIPILLGKNSSMMLQKYHTKSLGKYPVRDTNTEIEVFTLQ